MTHEEKLSQQDYIDNQIHEAVCQIATELSGYDVHLEWDIEHIGEIRDAIINYITSKTDIGANDIYPTIETDENL